MTAAILQAIMCRNAGAPEKPAIQCQRTATNLEILGNVPALREFDPAAKGAEFHTVFSRLQPARSHADVYDRRDAFKNRSIALDWAIAPRVPGGKRAIVVVFHGLGGSSDGKNERRLCWELKARGVTAVVYNRSGHARGTVPGSRFPNHADVEDAKWAIDFVRHNNPGAAIFCAGFSAGANAMVKYLGEVRDHPVKAAVAICNPLDLSRAYTYLQKNKPLDRRLASYLSKIYSRRRRIPRPVRSLREFDEMATGLPLEIYYARESSADALRNVGIPIMCVGARNDPVVHRSIVDLHDQIAAENPNVISVSTREGGHVGWVERGTLGTRAGCGWIERLVAEYVDSFLQCEGGV